MYRRTSVPSLRRVEYLSISQPRAVGWNTFTNLSLLAWFLIVKESKKDEPHLPTLLLGIV